VIPQQEYSTAVVRKLNALHTLTHPEQPNCATALHLIRCNTWDQWQLPVVQCKQAFPT